MNVGGWSTPGLSRFTLKRGIRYLLHRSVGGPQGRSGRVRKISPPLGFENRTAHHVSSRYTNYAIPAHASNLVSVTEVCKLFRPRIDWGKVFEGEFPICKKFSEQCFPRWKPEITRTITYLLTYLLTPWSRVLLEKLTSELCS
jgi:hypothetical protein